MLFIPNISLIQASDFINLPHGLCSYTRCCQFARLTSPVARSLREGTAVSVYVVPSPLPFSTSEPDPVSLTQERQVLGQTRSLFLRATSPTTQPSPSYDIRAHANFPSSQGPFYPHSYPRELSSPTTMSSTVLQNIDAGCKIADIALRCVQFLWELWKYKRESSSNMLQTQPIHYYAEHNTSASVSTNLVNITYHILAISKLLLIIGCFFLY